MRVSVNGTTLFFDVEGASLVPEDVTMCTRPTIVLLHGGPGADHATFKPFLSPLADHAQLIYLDHRGNGRSDESEPAKWTLAQWADDVAAFLDQLGIERPIVLGASFGGFVAQAFATAYPDRLSKLILLATGPRSDVDLSAAMFTKLGGERIGEIARRHLTATGGPDSEVEFLQECLPFYTVGEFDLKQLARSIDRPAPRRHFFGTAGEWHTMDFRAALGRVHCPTLIVHGEYDPILPLPLAREMHAALDPARSDLCVIKDAGHGWLDRPTAWFSPVERFVAEAC